MLLDTRDQRLVDKFNSFMENSPHANFYQLEAWAEVKSGWDRHCFYLEDDGEIVAGLQVLSIHDRRADKRMYYASRGPICDLNRTDLAMPLIEEARDFAQENNGFLLRIDPEVPYDKELVKKYRDLGVPFSYKIYSYSQWPMSMMLDINGRTADEVLASFTKSTRKDIRKAYRQGFELVVGGREDIPAFYDLITAMADNKGISLRNLDYFYRLYDAFSDKLRISFVRYQGKFICCSMMICFNNRGYALYGADPIYVNLQQSYFLDFEEIRYCCENNLRYYDMGGIISTDDNNGLYRFKRKFTNDNVVTWLGNMEFVFDREAYLKNVNLEKDIDFVPEDIEVGEK